MRRLIAIFAVIAPAAPKRMPHPHVARFGAMIDDADVTLGHTRILWRRE